MSTPRHGNLTTGEVARLIRVSRSTVSRLVDAGTLQGVINPLTGRRIITMDSVKKFLEDRNLHDHAAMQNGRMVHLACHATSLRDHVRHALGLRQGVTLSTSGGGAETLVQCAAHPPNLLVIANDLKDVTAQTVMRTLRHHTLPHQLNILYCRLADDEATIEKGLADEILAYDEWMVVEQLAARMASLLGFAEPAQEGSTTPRSHQRQWPRIPLRLPVRTVVYRPGKTNEILSGKATLLNVSEGGAFLTDMQFDKESLPTQAFRMHLFIDEKPLNDFEANCKVVRLQADGCLSAGVQFARISDANRRRIAALGSAA